MERLTDTNAEKQLLQEDSELILRETGVEKKSKALIFSKTLLILFMTYSNSNLSIKIRQNQDKYYQSDKMKNLTLITLFTLIAAPLSQQIHFLTLNQTIPFPSVQFFAKADDTINMTAEYSRNVSKFSFTLYSLDELEEFSNMYIITSRTLQNRSSHSFKKKYIVEQLYLVAVNTILDTEKTTLFLKITVMINNGIIRQHYSTVFKDQQPLPLLFYVDSPCKVKFRFISPPLMFGLYSPKDRYHPITNDYFETFLQLPGQWTFYFDLNQYIFYWQLKRVIINITTFSQSQCTNYCTSKQYPVVGFAVGFQKVCICDETLPQLVWNKVSQMCERSIPQSVCNNGIKEQGEQCDSGGQSGCLDCKVQVNYICQQDTSGLSICKVVKTGENTITGGMVAGIVIGSVLLTLLVVGLVYYIGVYRKEAEKEKKEKQTQQIRASKPKLDMKNSLSKKNEIYKKPVLNESKVMKRQNSMRLSAERKKINPFITCCICLTNQCQTILLCSHYFHKQCIILWLQRNKHCPLCPRSQTQIGRSIQRLKDFEEE